VLAAILAKIQNGDFVYHNILGVFTSRDNNKVLK